MEQQPDEKHREDICEEGRLGSCQISVVTGSAQLDGVASSRSSSLEGSAPIAQLPSSQEEGVDVISGAMFRIPDMEGNGDHSSEEVGQDIDESDEEGPFGNTNETSSSLSYQVAGGSSGQGLGGGDNHQFANNKKENPKALYNGRPSYDEEEEQQDQANKGAISTRSKYLGVEWANIIKARPWRAYYDKKHPSIGYFETEEEAAKAYDKYIQENMKGQATNFNVDGSLNVDVVTAASSWSAGGGGRQDEHDYHWSSSDSSLSSDEEEEEESSDERRKKKGRGRRPRPRSSHSASCDFKGVTYHRGQNLKPWGARAYYHGAVKYLGYYATAIEAAHAHDKFQRENNGPDAPCNFHEDGSRNENYVKRGMKKGKAGGGGGGGGRVSAATSNMSCDDVDAFQSYGNDEFPITDDEDEEAERTIGTTNHGGVANGKSATSKFRGVCRDRRSTGSVWIAQASIGGRQQKVGYFDDEEAAARAYDKAMYDAYGTEAIPIMNWHPYTKERNYHAKGTVWQSSKTPRTSATSFTPNKSHIGGTPTGGGGKAIRHKTSSFKGVYRYAKDKWIATGRLDGEAVSIGIFTDDEDAAKAYDHFQREHYPDPITNFLLSGKRNPAVKKRSWGKKHHHEEEEVCDQSSVDDSPEEDEPPASGGAAAAGGSSIGGGGGRSDKKKYTSTFKDVYFDQSMKKWRAMATVHGRTVAIGYFMEEEEAAHAYDSYIHEHLDPDAVVNFNEDGSRNEGIKGRNCRRKVAPGKGSDLGTGISSIGDGGGKQRMEVGGDGYNMDFEEQSEAASKRAGEAGIKSHWGGGAQGVTDPMVRNSGDGGMKRDNGEIGTEEGQWNKKRKADGNGGGNSVSEGAKAAEASAPSASTTAAIASPTAVPETPCLITEQQRHMIVRLLSTEIGKTQDREEQDLLARGITAVLKRNNYLEQLLVAFQLPHPSEAMADAHRETLVKTIKACIPHLDENHPQG